MKSLADKLGLSCQFGCGFKSPKIIETHISTVVVGDRLVLKFKKPVDFGFLNHTSFSARWKSACAEVLLNSRLSRDIYLGILPIGSERSIEFDESIIEQNLLTTFNPQEPTEDCADVAVVMHRIPDDAGLDKLIEYGNIEIEHHIVPAANKIANFHLTQIKRAIRDSDSHSALVRACRDNFAIVNSHGKLLCEASRSSSSLVERFTNSFLSENSALFDARINGHHVIDGHGDLRAEHVCFINDEPQVIDCLEFSSELRTVDVLNDIAFLTMDFDIRGRTDLSAAFIESYARCLNESFIPDLFFFYEAYRAMVRAKVSLLTADSLPQDDDKHSTAVAAAE
ncbi:MAG: hypothetical protein KDD66_06825, partial [Bdellovibrionales bacterium]|nr:hypothetical protein [Bdellovibrionales bacterium]